MSNILYEDYLIEFEKNPEIRLVSRQSWAVYKCKFWSWKKALEYLKWKKTSSIVNNRFWKFKITDEHIKDILAESKHGVSKKDIAKKYWVDVRTIYRYIKIR